LCIEKAEKLREEWGPKFGDWVMTPNGASLLLATDASRPDYYWTELAPHQAATYDHRWYHRAELIPLFQPRQIIEMLEERGQYWEMKHLASMDEYAVLVYGGHRMPGQRISKVGPDPACALLRAWLEVVSRGDPRRGKEE